MRTRTSPADGHGTVITYDNQDMAESAGSPLRRVTEAPFTRRAWSELGYTLASCWLAVAAVAFLVPMLANGLLWGISAGPLRWFGRLARTLARELLGEDIAPPPPFRPLLLTKVATPDHAAANRLAAAAVSAGGRARPWETKPGVTLKLLTRPRIEELAAAAGVSAVMDQAPNAFGNWFGARVLDPVAWRARGYFGLKLILSAAGVAVIAGCWLGGLFFLTFPAWWSLGLSGVFGIVNVAAAFTLLPLGAALLLAGPWLTHGLVETDRWLMRGLLGPGLPSARIRVLEQTRAHAVDDSAARLRSIERNLHDGTQAQLVAVAMKLGLAREKLAESGDVDLTRITRLVTDAHRGAVEAIADLRTLARGIHPPVLDNGLADALATLADRSAVPVELITDIPERPSAAIETIAYFSAAELLTNVARHSGARHATLEAVHVTGLLRVRVTDDGAGGARPVPNGGLRGLAERVRTVDGRIEVDSPQGGPTTVTVELPSHA
ncbi:MAG TPA: sensor domain-containing protein [Trebonia sp.]|jgi:signal transduction histidine kinase|nr:sensor domain-containing protein [Trebonia sp.]